MNTNFKLIILVFLVGFPIFSIAQDYDKNFPEINPGIIPSAPAFNILGVNPELVTRPSDVKSFKVDWRIKNYKIAPDLALEAQPLWWVHYRNKGIEKYQKSNQLAKILSTTSVSMATAKIDGVNHMAYAFKVNLYKEKDPYLDQELLSNYEIMKSEIMHDYEVRLDSLIHLLDLTDSQVEKKNLRQEVITQKILIKEARQELMDRIKVLGAEYVQQNWNMDMVDLAFGQVYKYDNGGLDSLKFKKAGYGIWINAAKGISHHSLFTGLVRVNRIGQNTDLMLGASYRFGSSKFNFFLEFVMNKYQNNADNGFADDELFAAKREVDLGNAWYEFGDGDGYSAYNISYGGDFRLSRKVLLNFALRTQFKEDKGFEQFLPVANIVCLMN